MKPCKSNTTTKASERITRRDVLKVTAGMAAAGLVASSGLALGKTTAEPKNSFALDQGQDGGDLLFTFAVSTDPHLAQTRPGHPSGIESFKTMLEKIKALPRKPDFHLSTGDLVLAEKGRWLAEAQRVCPVHVVPGNKEGAESRKICRKLFPKDSKSADFYSFTHKKCLFIGLANAIPDEHYGHFSSERMNGKRQVEWVEKQFAKHAKRTKHSFVFGHIPPHPQTKDSNMFIGINDQKWFRQVVLQNKPTAMFFGHLHHRLRFNIGKTPVYVVRSSNWNFNNEPNGMLLVSVYQRGIRTSFLPIGSKGGSGKIKSRED